MKRTDLQILIAVFAYSMLFYKQLAGLNFFLFSIIIVVIQVLSNPALLKNRGYLFFSLSAVISGFFILLNGTAMAVLINILSLAATAACTVQNGSSAFVSLLSGMFSIGSGIGFMFADIGQRNFQHQGGVKFWKSFLLLFVVPVVVVILFFAIYQKANRLFWEFTKDINLDFISWQWVGFTITGIFLLYGLFKVRAIDPLHKWDKKISNRFDTNQLPGDEVSESKYSLINRSAIVLLSLLNLLILVLNIIDIKMVWVSGALPDGMGFADYVHQGVGMLIFSIILSITIIMIYFRGGLNFFRKNSTARALAMIWVVQNIIMIVSNMLKNDMYISHYGLTMMRIGVYVWLLLAIGGLVSTFVKVAHKRTNIFLVRVNFIITFSVLLLYSGFNWDRIIADHHESHFENPDRNYLLRLSDDALPVLLSLESHNPSAGKELTQSFSGLFGRDDSYLYDQKTYLDRKLYRFLRRIDQTDVRSFRISDETTLAKIRKLDAEGKIVEITLLSEKIEEGNELKDLKNLKNLSLNNCNFSDVTDFRSLEKLDRLQIMNPEGLNTDSLLLPASLKHLSLNHVKLFDLSILKQTQNLESGEFFDLSQPDMSELPKSITSISLSDCRLDSLSWISNLPKLKNLTIANCDIPKQPLPKAAANLTTLNLISNYNSLEIPVLISELTGNNTIEYVSMSGGHFESVYDFGFILAKKKGITEFKDTLLAFPNARSISLTSMGFSSIKGIRMIGNPEYLDLSNNGIYGLDGIQFLTKLQELHLSGNRSFNSEILELLVGLKTLSVSSCDLTGINLPPSLERLIISSNYSLDGMRVNFPKTLKYLDISNTGTTDVSFISALPNLEELNITNLSISDYSAIMKSTKLKRLRMGYVTTEKLDELKEALPNTEILTGYTSSIDISEKGRR